MPCRFSALALNGKPKHFVFSAGRLPSRGTSGAEPTLEPMLCHEVKRQRLGLGVLAFAQSQRQDRGRPDACPRREAVMDLA